jgi:serine protease AprX
LPRRTEHHVSSPALGPPARDRFVLSAPLPASRSPLMLGDGPPAPADDPLRLIITAPDASQRDALKKLFLEQDPGNRITVDLPLIHGFAVEVSPNAIQILPDLGKVARDVRVFLDNEVSIPEPPQPDRGPRPTAGLDVATGAMGLDRLWDKGLTGKGVGIAVIDTGIAPHDDVKDRIVAFKDFVNGKTEPYDDQGHGTHVSSIAAGDGEASHGRYKGCAPEASLIGIKVLDKNGNGSFSDVIAGIQWAIENKDRYGIGVINLSLGGRAKQSYKDDPVAQAIEAAAAAGIVPCVAAGNNGPVGRTINTPAHALDAFTIGALDDMGTVGRDDDAVADFSGRGPSPFDSLAKPDLLAPGVDITAADWRSPNGYRTLSGTSMATPMVAGAVALIRGARPDLTPTQIKDVFMQTAQPVPGPYDPNAEGRGSVDPVAAWTSLPPAPT